MGELSAGQVESGMAAAVAVLAGVGGSLYRLNGTDLGGGIRVGAGGATVGRGGVSGDLV